MTTSYETQEDRVLDRYGTQPNLNADGNQVWNPQVGIYHKPAINEADSYGGIVGALQDIMVQNAIIPKAYPHNFAGIIAAIQDLSFAQNTPPVVPGPNPGNGQIIIDIDGKPEFDILYPMPDGSLWFDTRQGRLFVSIENEWYQTNGADGLPIVTNTPKTPGVEHPVPGQFWWDASTNQLYIFDGIFELPDGGFTDDPTAGGAPVWKLITDGLADAFQTTLTLPLGNPLGLDPYVFINVTPPERGDEMMVQADFNAWLYESVKELDTAIFEKSAVHIGENKPVDPRAGDMWFDTAALELSIYYIDDTTSQWVPTSTAYSYSADLATLSASLEAETRNRERAVTDLYTHVQGLFAGNIPDVDTLEAKVSALEEHVNNHPQPDLSGYATDGELTAQVNDLQYKIDTLTNSIPDITPLASNTAVANLANTVNQLPSKGYVDQSIADAQPDLSHLVTQHDIDQSISNITTQYLPRNGGTLTGAFVVNKQEMSKPAFDFSQERWYSYNTHKYATNGLGDHYATFGTNEKAWEYAWDFSSNEDFCWVYGDSNKVFSITKDGPACSRLIIGDFQPNDNETGRRLTNKIDVKERLETYQLAFEQMRQGVSSATDLDSLKSNILSALASV